VEEFMMARKSVFALVMVVVLLVTAGFGTCGEDDKSVSVRDLYENLDEFTKVRINLPWGGAVVAISPDVMKQIELVNAEVQLYAGNRNVPDSNTLRVDYHGPSLAGKANINFHIVRMDGTIVRSVTSPSPLFCSDFEKFPLIAAMRLWHVPLTTHWNLVTITLADDGNKKNK
jgi:hypothetical protein